MPTLKQRKDGCYYITHWHLDFNTWQIDRDGVFFLKGYGVDVEDRFPTEVFMQMWERRLVYVGDDRKKYWRKFDLYSESHSGAPVTMDDVDLAKCRVVEPMTEPGRPYHHASDSQITEFPDRVLRWRIGWYRLRNNESGFVIEAFVDGQRTRWVAIKEERPAHGVFISRQRALNAVLFLAEGLVVPSEEERQVVNIWKADNGQRREVIALYDTSYGRRWIQVIE